MNLRNFSTAALLIGAALSSNVEAQVFMGQTYGEKQYGSWVGTLVSREADYRFRSYTLSGNWGLIVDEATPNCTLLLEMAMVPNAPAPRSYAEESMHGSIRVDQNEVFPITVTTRVAMGDTLVIFNVEPFADSAKLIEQMMNGSVLRTQLRIDEQDTYSTFALNGFAVSFSREQAACASTLPAKPSAPPRPTKKPAPSNGKFL